MACFLIYALVQQANQRRQSDAHLSELPLGGSDSLAHKRHAEDLV